MRGIRNILRHSTSAGISASPNVVEEAERQFYDAYVQAGQTVFDVGANIGDMAALFSQLTDNGVVHAFEASSRTCTQLRKRCQAENLANVIVNHLAVSDKEGLVALHVYDDEHSGWNSLADRPLHKYGVAMQVKTVEQVEATTIDQYCSLNDISHIDLLKVDVEGAEYQVLLGARRMFLAKKIRCCAFEYGQTTFDMGNRPVDIARFVGDVGYSIRNVVTGDPVFPGKSVSEARFSTHVLEPLR